MSETRPKPWLPAPDDKQDAQGHVWFDYHGTPTCKRCGLVRQADGNKPCRGVLPSISLRDGGPDIVPQPFGTYSPEGE